MSRAAVPHEYLTLELLIGSRTSEGYPVAVVESPAVRGPSACHLGRDQKLQDALNTIDASDAKAAFLMDVSADIFDRIVRDRNPKRVGCAPFQRSYALRFLPANFMQLHKPQVEKSISAGVWLMPVGSSFYRRRFCECLPLEVHPESYCKRIG